MKRAFGMIEVSFNLVYLLVVLVIGIFLLMNGNTTAGIMAIVLLTGDSFHLIPRIILILTKKENQMSRALGLGKQITSITMTIFYLFLWHIGLKLFSINDVFFWTLTIYLLAFIRIILCLLPHNKWSDQYPPIEFAISRNIPFLFQGIMVIVLFFNYRAILIGLEFAWLAISLSFILYIPVVLFANIMPKIGMLMLPKSLCYLWLLAMFLSL